MRRWLGAAVAGALAGWTALAGPLVEALRPEVALTMDATGVVHVRCGVTPVGPAGYSGRRVELNLSFAPEGGAWRIVAACTDVPLLRAGETKACVNWRIRLPVGQYTLTWGDPCEGTAVVSFSVAHDKAGKNVLVAPQRFLTPLTPYTVPVAGAPTWQDDPEARRAAAWAQASLAEDLAVCARTIETVEVRARLFPDASLGVRKPGMTYAQVITPGYVVRLKAKDREFEYRVAGETLVRVPDLPSGRAPDEIWSLHIYAYHPTVDTLLHSYVACSPDAVLPLARWAPRSLPPWEAALRLLIEGGIAPGEEALGYSSEFPVSGVTLASVRLENGVLTVVLADPEHRTSGGACRTGILRAQIEKTVLQFPEVREVRILPPEALQP